MQIRMQQPETLTKAQSIAVNLDAIMHQSQFKSKNWISKPNNNYRKPTAAATGHQVGLVYNRATGFKRNFNRDSESANNSQPFGYRAPSVELAQVSAASGKQYNGAKKAKFNNSKLSDAQKQQCFQNSLCFNCMKAGHHARDCPSKSKNLTTRQ